MRAVLLSWERTLTYAAVLGRHRGSAICLPRCYVTVLSDRIGPTRTRFHVNLQSDVNVAIMSSGNEPITQLVQELSQAKTWPEQLKESLEKGLDITSQIKEVDERVEALEKRARKVTDELRNELGCAHPQTRMVFQAMVDMLIEWNIFKDSLEP